MNIFFKVKGVSDRFFIIEVSEIKQVVYAVLCRGSKYPQTTPRPVVSELPLQVQFYYKYC